MSSHCREVSHPPDLLYAAPGAGLGHLTRACAICLHLADLEVNARIVTHSPYAHGLARLTGCGIDFIPRRHWVGEVPRYVQRLNPGLVVLDTFPWGIRGEWRRLTQLRYVTIARRIKVNAYLDAARLSWRSESPHLARILAIEPLLPDHQALLLQSGGELRCLRNRIRFPAERFPTPVPRPLQTLLENTRLWLVVHSGPAHEISALLQAARHDMAVTTERGQRKTLAAILSHPESNLEAIPASEGPARPDCPVFEYFPASRLFASAFRVVTGGGYNSVAELAAMPSKHICLPFERRYDDQAGRLRTLRGQPASGESRRQDIGHGEVNRHSRTMWDIGAMEAAHLLKRWLKRQRR